jgi:hypothetical protein
VFFLDSGYRSGLSLLLLPGFVFGMLCDAIVLTWLYEGSGSSVLLAALWHTSFNLGAATEAGEGLLGMVVTVFVIASAMVITRRWRADEAAAATGTQG